MTYAISDIHGHYDKYLAMLEKINFGDADTLYVLGDVIDRGEHGIKLLLDILHRPNAVMLLGNHEAMMLDTLLGFTQITAGSVTALGSWLLNGGGPTFKGYMDSESADRISILEMLEKMPYYLEITVGENDFVLLHGGLEDFLPERPLGSYSRDDIVWAEPDLEHGYFLDKFTVIGHTPTMSFGGEPKIFRNGKLFDIDCGCAFDGGRLGCLCLDNLEETYV